MDITGLKYSQVSSLLLYFSPIIDFFPREERNIKTQCLNRALALSEHREALDGGKERKARVKIKENQHVTIKRQGHKLFCCILI